MSECGRTDSPSRGLKRSSQCVRFWAVVIVFIVDKALVKKNVCYLTTEYFDLDILMPAP
jgi:hypothetical protein